MMKENTFAVSLTLEDLKRRRLVIPCFQRPYRWTRDEAAVLFDDLMAFQEVEARFVDPLFARHDRDGKARSQGRRTLRS